MRPIDAEPIERFIENGLNCKDPQKRFGHDAIEILTEVHYAPTIAPPPNAPLTLEELREMDGEPVWVCDPNDHLIGRYGLVWVKPGWHQDNFCVQMLGGIRAYFSDYSNTWIAYRRRPEGTCND